MVRNIQIGLGAGRLLASFSCGAMIVGLGLGTPVQAKQSVAVPGSYPPGMIIIKQSERQLYFTQRRRHRDPLPRRPSARPARRGAAQTSIEGKYIRPDWSPPESVSRDHPELPPLIPGGAPNNPMGEAALTLKLDEVAIHGTSNKMRKSVGTAASYGCIRMLNEDVVDLYGRVKVGTPVVSIP